MTLPRSRLRLVLLAIGLLMPYVVRLPWGWEWMAQYLMLGPMGALFFHLLNAMVWAPLIGLTWVYRDLRWLWLPAVVGLGLLGWGHAVMDLAADAQSGIALMILPVLAAVPMLAAAVLAWSLDFWLAKRSARQQPAPTAGAR